MVNAAERTIMAQQTVKWGAIAYFKGYQPAEKPDKRFTKRDFRFNIVSTLCPTNVLVSHRPPERTFLSCFLRMTYTFNGF